MLLDEASRGSTDSDDQIRRPLGIEGVEIFNKFAKGFDFDFFESMTSIDDSFDNSRSVSSLIWRYEYKVFSSLLFVSSNYTILHNSVYLSEMI